MVLNAIMQVYKDFLNLTTIPINYQYSIGITILIYSHVGFFKPLLMLITDIMHSLTPIQHWSRRYMDVKTYIYNLLPGIANAQR